MQGEKLEQLTRHRNHCVAKHCPVSSSVPSPLGATGKEDNNLLLESLGIAAELKIIGHGKSVTSLSSWGSQVRGKWTRSKLGMTLLRSVIALIRRKGCMLDWVSDWILNRIPDGISHRILGQILFASLLLDHLRMRICWHHLVQQPYHGRMVASINLSLILISGTMSSYSLFFRKAFKPEIR